MVVGPKLICTFLLALLSFAHLCQALSFSSIFFGSEEENKDPDRPLMCYRGIKYFIGQEEIDDNVACERNFMEKAASMHKYCYRFTSHSGATDFVKRGCSVMICTPLGSGCTKMAFEGVEGEMCCCSDTSYCNGALASRSHGISGLFLLFAIALLSICLQIHRP